MMESDDVTILIVLALCVGLGIGLFLGLDSQEAKVAKLEKEAKRLTTNVIEAEFYVTILDLKVQALLNIWSKLIEEEGKTIYYNDEALAND